MSTHSETLDDEQPQNNAQTYTRPKTIPYFIPPPSKNLGEPVVCIRNMTKEYVIAGRQDAVVALRGININENSEFYPIHKGEFVMVRGPSGGGKTTLLNMIGTIDKATSGQLELFGKVIDNKSPDSELSKLRLETIGFVFQTFNLLATLTSFENVELPMTVLNKLSSRDTKKTATSLLKMVGLQDRMGHLPSELSGGEQQRVTIARALSNNPKLLLLDEPTGDLDTANTIQVMDLILNINLKGTTCIMVTHNPDLECYADRLLYFQDGRIVRQCINTRQSRLDEEKYQDRKSVV